MKHKWIAGGVDNGSPTLVCISCQLRWYPNQNEPKSECKGLFRAFSNDEEEVSN
jgi:hypothetical protein